MKLFNAIKALPLIQAAKDGKTIQKWDCGQWFDCTNQSDLSFRHSIAEYRIKPEPKMRAWKPEEVPVGAIVKTNDTGSRWVIIGVNNEGQIAIAGDDEMWSPSWVLSNYTHSLDHGKTWLPCGVEE